MQRYLNIVLWEFLENLPVVMVAAATIWLWAHHNKKYAALIGVLGIIASAVFIRVTEPMKRGADFQEPLETTLINIVLFIIFLFLFTLYLATESKWSNWKMDVILGSAAGLILGAAQILTAAGLPPLGIFLHSLAMALTSAIGLVGTRQLKSKTLPQALVGAVVVTAAMTLTMSILDYGYVFK